MLLLPIMLHAQHHTLAESLLNVKNAGDAGVWLQKFEARFLAAANLPVSVFATVAQRPHPMLADLTERDFMTVFQDGNGRNRLNTGNFVVPINMAADFPFNGNSVKVPAHLKTYKDCHYRHALVACLAVLAMGYVAGLAELQRVCLSKEETIYDDITLLENTTYANYFNILQRRGLPRRKYLHILENDADDKVLPEGDRLSFIGLNMQELFFGFVEQALHSGLSRDALVENAEGQFRLIERVLSV